MLRNVTVKALRDQRRSLLAWACGFVLLVAIYAAGTRASATTPTTPA